MRGIELKHTGVRSFMLKGLTARWGIDGNRPPMPPTLRTALVAWYNTEIQRATNFDVIESYAEDFTANKWLDNQNRAVFTKTAKSFRVTNALTADPFLETGAKKYMPEMVVKVSGLQPGVTGLRYRYGAYTDLVHITQDGIYTLPAGKAGTVPDGYNGFAIVNNTLGECDITVEQLPTSKLTDLSGNGHHLHLYGYTGTPTNGINAEDFTASKWLDNQNRAVFTKTAKSIRITNALTADPFLETGAQKYASEMVVKVSGLQPGVTGLRYRYGAYNDTLLLAQDGIYALPAGIPGASPDGYNGFSAAAAFGECDITVEQLPTSKLTNGINADGWLQSAGVGYGISYGQPLLTDYTVCMTREHAAGNTGTLASKALAFKQGAFIFEVKSIVLNSSAVYSRGTGTSVTYAPTGFVYQTKDSYNGTPITAGTAGDFDTLLVGALRPKDLQPYTGSYKSFVLFNRTLTAEELAYVKRWMA